MSIEKTLAKHPTRLSLKTLSLFAVVKHKAAVNQLHLSALPIELREEVQHIEQSIQQTIVEQRLRESGQHYRNKFDLCC